MKANKRNSLDRKDCKIIEFVGIAGVGKTHISRQVNTSLNNSIVANRVSLTIINHFVFLLSNIGLCIFIIRIIFKQKLRITQSVKYILKVLRYYERLFYCVRKKFKYIIYDQGIFQELRSIRRKSHPTELIEMIYKNLFSHLDIVVTVHADYDTIIDRRTTRDNKVIIGGQYKDILEAYKQFEESMNRTIQDINAVKEYNNILHYKYSNNDQESVAELISMIEERS